jgi:uncharacterized NAD(P)/FAD-binding protein YdhS
MDLGRNGSRTKQAQSLRPSFSDRGIFLSLRGAPLCGATKQSSWIAAPGFAGLAMTNRHNVPAAQTLSVMTNFSNPNAFAVAIIGGGFSGTMVAVHLLRLAEPGTRIVVVERRTELGRGVAYCTERDEHLLNVAADRMGAFPDQPTQFYEWVRDRAGRPGFPATVEPGDYLPRRLFGDYVHELFKQARSNAPEIEVEVLNATAVDLEEIGTGARIALDDGRVIEAEKVVLALGNLPGEYPIPRPLPIYRTPRYVHIPWSENALEGLAPDDDVLLVGQGLTAVDLIVQLAARKHRGVIHALSRRGVRPQTHQRVPEYPSFLDREAPPTTVRALVRRVRAEVRDAAAAGIDWRAVIDALRPHTQAVWHGLSWTERAKFMRFVRPFWEGHRHRIAPASAAVLDQLGADGRLQFHAGRLQVLESEGDGVGALFRRRGSLQHVSLRVAKVINCSGPRTDYSKYQHPLLIHLLARGLIDHDPLALGIVARPTGEVLRYRGEPLGWLFTLGAPLKSVSWETNAVREIRLQARALAERLVNAIGAGDRDRQAAGVS